MAGFAGNLITGQPFELTSDKAAAQAYQGPVINYSHDTLDRPTYQIIPHGLLTEPGIKPQSVTVKEEQNVPRFFINESSAGFDVLAASFYLVSRYEEYLPGQPDSYGRYDHQQSLAHQAGFLQRPLVNEWMQQLRAGLTQQFGSLPNPPKPVAFLPTYDIDIAWSYRHKGWLRNMGALLLLIVKGRWASFAERIAVLRGKRADPFDAYAWMNQLHERHHLKPYYFFLLAIKRGRYDKNISPHHPAMQALITDHLIRYPVGIHPSWRSGDENAWLQKEIDLLAAVTGKKVLASRQHYIRMRLPDTYRHLIEAGIGFDFSMGYGSINGFRASVSTAYYWYDLERECTTSLMLFPFCFMDANAYYEERISAAAALEEMRHYRNAVHQANGSLIMIWHNNFLGTQKEMLEWRAVYETFIAETVAGLPLSY